MIQVDALRDVTAALDALDSRDTAAVLAAVWGGLELAGAVGHQVAAAGGRWRRLAGNARAVEGELQRYLASSDSLAHIALALPTTSAGVVDPEQAVTVIVDYAQTARRVLSAAQEHATAWGDRRVCGHGATLATELAEAWNGNRPTYRTPDAPTQ